MSDHPTFFTTQQAAQYVNVHTMTMHRWLKKGVVPGAFKLGGRWRVKKDIFDKHFEISNMQAGQ